MSNCRLVINFIKGTLIAFFLSFLARETVVTKEFFYYSELNVQMEHYGIAHALGGARVILRRAERVPGEWQE